MAQEQSIPGTLLEISTQRKNLLNAVMSADTNPFYAAWQIVDLDLAHLQRLTRQRPYKAAALSEEHYILSRLKSVDKPWDKPHLMTTYLLYKAYKSEHPTDRQAYRAMFAATQPALKFPEQESEILIELSQAGDTFAKHLVSPKKANAAWFFGNNKNSAEMVMGMIIATDNLRSNNLNWQDIDNFIRLGVPILALPAVQFHLISSTKIFEYSQNLWFPHPLHLLHIEATLNQSSELSKIKEFVHQLTIEALKSPLALGNDGNWLIAQTHRLADKYLEKFHRIRNQYPDYGKQVVNLLNQVPRGEKRIQAITGLNTDFRNCLFAEYNIKLLWAYKAALELNLAYTTGNKDTQQQLQSSFAQFQLFLNEAVY